MIERERDRQKSFNRYGLRKRSVGQVKSYGGRHRCRCIDVARTLLRIVMRWLCRLGRLLVTVMSSCCRLHRSGLCATIKSAVQIAHLRPRERRRKNDDCCNSDDWLRGAHNAISLAARRTRQQASWFASPLSLQANAMLKFVQQKSAQSGSEYSFSRQGLTRGPGHFTCRSSAAGIIKAEKPPG